MLVTDLLDVVQMRLFSCIISFFNLFKNYGYIYFSLLSHSFLKF